MNSKLAFVLVTSLLFPLMGSAQAFEKEPQENKRSNPSPLSGVAIQSAGMIMDASFEAQLENFRKLAPESNILDRDLSGFSKDIGFYDQSSGAFSIYVDFPIEWELFDYLSPKIRIGLQFMHYGALNYSLSRSDYFRVDTLTNSSGRSLYVDSISSQHIDIEYSQDQILVDVGILFSSNENSRWAVKGGFSLAAGFTQSAGTRMFYDRSAEYTAQLAGIVYSNDYYSEEESFRNDGGFVGVASIPLILDFRIARKGNFFARSHLYTEVRPFLYYTSIPEISNQTQSGLSFGFGFRYEI
jgi:hypothetical protein